MSTIDEKYLGDRVKELENRITDTVTEGSTDVPTSEAVYNAIQSAGGGIRFEAPLPPAQASNTDTIIISSGSTEIQISSNTYDVIGKTFFTKYTTLYMWVNMESFDCTTIEGLTEHMILITNSTADVGNNGNVGRVDQWTTNTGYAVIPIYGYLNLNILKV